MFKADQLKDGVLNRFSIQIPAGTTLFKQNDKGNTLYIIVEGSVQLTHRLGQNERVIGTLGPGSIVGEKALCVTAPYRRSFTAIADTDSVALEFDSASLKSLAVKIPDFTLKLLQVVVERLDRSNALVAVLQTAHPVDRVGQYLMHLCEHHSTAKGAGKEISVTSESIHATANVDMQTASDCLKALIDAKLVTAKDKAYFIANENAVLQHLSSLKDRLAA